MAYLGSKIEFTASLLPNKAKDDDFKKFFDYVNQEGKRIRIPRTEVIAKKKEDTLKNILEYLKNEFKSDKVDSYGIIKLIDSNIKGNNTLLDIEPFIVVTVLIYSKPKKVSKKKDDTK